MYLPRICKKYHELLYILGKYFCTFLHKKSVQFSHLNNSHIVHISISLFYNMSLYFYCIFYMYVCMYPSDSQYWLPPFPATFLVCANLLGNKFDSDSDTATFRIRETSSFQVSCVAVFVLVLLSDPQLVAL